MSSRYHFADILKFGGKKEFAAIVSAVQSHFSHIGRPGNISLRSVKESRGWECNHWQGVP